MREREREKGVRKNKVDRERNQDFLETSGGQTCDVGAGNTVTEITS